MQKRDIIPGKEYGYRALPKRPTELEHVQVLEQARSKWRVEWIDPNPGLKDYVASTNLVVAWKDRRAFLTDEGNWERLHAACRQAWPGREHPLSEAVDTVLAATGEDIWVGSHGELSAMPDVVDRASQRSQIEMHVTPPAFRDRGGAMHFSFDTAIELAQAFAAVEPHSVLLDVETAQEHYEQEAREMGNSRLVPLVNRWRAGWALCRQWAGFDQALAERDAEIKRLRRIIDDIRYELRRAGQDDLTAKIDRKLRR